MKRFSFSFFFFQRRKSPGVFASFGSRGPRYTLFSGLMSSKSFFHKFFAISHPSEFEGVKGFWSVKPLVASFGKITPEEEKENEALVRACTPRAYVWDFVPQIGETPGVHVPDPFVFLNCM